MTTDASLYGTTPHHPFDEQGVGMSIRSALHLPRRRSPRTTSLSRALSRATTPAVREELLYLQRTR